MNPVRLLRALAAMALVLVAAQCSAGATTLASVPTITPRPTAYMLSREEAMQRAVEEAKRSAPEVGIAEARIDDVTTERLNRAEAEQRLGQRHQPGRDGAVPAWWVRVRGYFRYQGMAPAGSAVPYLYEANERDFAYDILNGELMGGSIPATRLVSPTATIGPPTPVPPTITPTPTRLTPVPSALPTSRSFVPCGLELYRHGEGYDARARDCFWQAYRNSIAAEFTTMKLTDEGDPVTYTARILSPNLIEVTEDSRDRMSQWHYGLFRDTCHQMDRLFFQYGPNANGGYVFSLTGCSDGKEKVF